MKTTWYLLAAIAGVAGLFALWNPARSAAGPSTPTLSPNASSPAEEDAREEGLEALDTALPDSVTDPRTTLPLDPSSSESDRPPFPFEDEEDHRKHTSAPATPEELAELRAYAQTTIEGIRHDESQIQLQGIERRIQELEHRMPKLTEQLGLDEKVSRELLTLLRRELDREAEYALLREKGAEQEQIDELRNRDREEIDRDLRKLLTEEQLRKLR